MGGVRRTGQEAREAEMVVQQIQGAVPVAIRFLVLPATTAGDRGEVSLELASGYRIAVMLPKRHFRVLRLLIEARFEDMDVDSDLRGLRTVAAIRTRYAKQVGEVAEITVPSLRRYVRDIRAAFQLAFEQVADEVGCPDLDWGNTVIETVLGLGYRIGKVSIVYIDYSAAPPAVIPEAS